MTLVLFDALTYRLGKLLIHLGDDFRLGATSAGRLTGDRFIGAVWRQQLPVRQADILGVDGGGA